eukprot:CAMPEP_0204209388 /NCGR_PEP_ID=MMETSP0361-20130328/73179_1 /ASSEMBLY_ACC=CAM_ASM_000343 /TAXON_ID=268821 /ORGANISM="Scrippsiella Hangoei, Strain SHTV-5" /LENGTH=30 /DNA_ID= /DNA_START= /DNA_END= /DNA_ORIENTATION=
MKSTETPDRHERATTGEKVIDEKRETSATR